MLHAGCERPIRDRGKERGASSYFGVTHAGCDTPRRGGHWATMKGIWLENQLSTIVIDTLANEKQGCCPAMALASPS